MKKSGVTLITLTIIILIMSILTGVAIPVGVNTYRGAEQTKFQSEISQIEILTSNYIRRNSGNDLTPYTWDVSSIMTEDFEGETITAGKMQVYVVDLSKIDAQNTNLGTLENGAKDRYLYSETTGHVYYEMGKKIGRNTYYRLSEIKE